MHGMELHVVRACLRDSLALSKLNLPFEKFALLQMMLVP